MTHESRVVVYPGSPEFGAKYLNYHRYRLKICVCSLVCTVAIVLVAASIVLQITNSSNIFPRSYELGEGDMRAVPVSTLFCEGITLGRDMNSRRLRVLSTLRLSTQKQRTNLTTQLYVAENQYWYKAFYLLEGSSMLINARSDSYFKLIILRGRERLDEWIKSSEERARTSGLLAGVTPHGASSVNYRTTKITYKLSVQAADNYYILFRHITGPKSLALLDLAVSLNRVVYDVGPALFACVAQPGKSCDARLLFGSHESVVIEVMAPDSLVYINNIFTRWQCETRIWFYIATFGGFFFLTVIAGIIFYVTCVSAKRRKLNAKMAEFERRKSVNEMLVAPVPTFSRSSSIRSHGSLRRYPPSRTPSLRSQTSLATNASFRREARPLLPSVPMYHGIPADDDSDPGAETKRDENDNVEDNLDAHGNRPRHRADSTDDDVSFHSFCSFDTGTRPRAASFSTFRQRSNSDVSNSHEDGNLPRSSRAHSFTANSTSSSPRVSRENRSKSFSHFDSSRPRINSDENCTGLSTLRRPFSFPAVVHDPPKQNVKQRLMCREEQISNGPLENCEENNHSSVLIMAQSVDGNHTDINFDNVTQPPEDIWVVKSAEPVVEMNGKVGGRKEVKAKGSHTLPNGLVKKREKKRDCHRWKPRLSVVSESEV